MQDRPDLTARNAILSLVSQRDAKATVCPSEVARVLARSRDGEDRQWRLRMPEVHAAADLLLEEGQVQLSWKGETRPERAGPYRLGRGRAFPQKCRP